MDHQIIHKKLSYEHFTPVSECSVDFLESVIKDRKT